MKDPIGMLGDSLESIILLKSVLGDDFNLPQSLDSIWPTEEGVAYWGFSDGVLFTRELFSFGE